VPGPSALITALSVEGLPTDRFIFEGFLPAKAEGRRKQLAGLALEPRTLVFYESPHRVQDSLKAMVEVFGSERKAVLARELTKRFETLIADSLGNLLERVAADQNQQRGEIVLAVEGLSREQQQADELPELEKMLIVLLEELSVKQSVALAVRLTGVNKNTVYEMALRLNKAGP
jgi:16S rRNA (cytidine1402-2'-O)-methyltransferase